MKLNIEKYQKELITLCEKYDVKSMSIFGSSVNDTFNQSSDIDVLIAFKELSVEKYTDNFFDLRHELESLFSRKVDLITENSLSNPYFIESINANSQRVYAA